MQKLYIDIETYSRIDLRKASAYRYTEDPEFEIMMAGWALDDDPVQVAFGADVFDVPGLFDARVLKVAHNAAFERICFSVFARGQYELEPGEYLNPEHWEDTAARAAEWGYPRGLDALAKALGGEQKDSAGTLLINWFCKPDRNGKRRRPEDHPEKWAKFVEYCRQDVVTLRDVDKALPDWPTETERQLYLADQRINDRGIPVDRFMVECAVEAAEANREDQRDELELLTGLDNPNSTTQLLGWFHAEGLDLPDLKADTVKAALARPDLPEGTRRALELRKELALVASKKYTAALERTSDDDRLRGAFQFYGAHTGRWAGRGVQLQNLPRESLIPKSMEVEPDEKKDAIISDAVLDLKLTGAAPAVTLKALVRSMFDGPFTVVDYSAIEARVIAWLAGEQWALDAFAAGRDIYVETAERMGGMTRQAGKVAVLALGYNGGIGSLQAMGAEGTDYYLKHLVHQWRDANPAIVGFWQDVEKGFMRGSGTAGETELISFERDGDDRLIRLPSGRALVYHDVRVTWVTDAWGNRRRRATFLDPKPGQPRVGTYGGRLSENITQAVARDVLGQAILNLDAAGIPAVGHVHDEILTLGGYSVDKVREYMLDMPDWTAGLPLAAEGFTCQRYRKG